MKTLYVSDSLRTGQRRNVVGKSKENVVVIHRCDGVEMNRYTSKRVVYHLDDGTGCIHSLSNMKRAYCQNGQWTALIDCETVMKA